MYAHYFGTLTTKFVIISKDFRPEGEIINVSSKAEARRIAKEKGAEPWNF